MSIKVTSVYDDMNTEFFGVQDVPDEKDKRIAELEGFADWALRVASMAGHNEHALALNRICDEARKVLNR